MKMHSRSVYDPLGLRRMKAGIAWCLKPAKESGLDIAPNPQLSPRFGESTRSRLFHTFDVLRRRGRGDEHGEHFPLLCWFGRPQGVGRSLCTTNRTKRPLASTDTPLGHDGAFWRWQMGWPRKAARRWRSDRPARFGTRI